ncbi:NAD(P)H-quinone oxidoreductase [Rhizobium sp. SSA_523]|uniref:NAD(P)H-quinone oxidoreductase n=1 Tax=Rhizobium sp. SSA_523 TaxID=2952477 RepID=UPI00265905E6|nr:NAD(P)H-quinone oxidoreductase [Rhizobium sp. SSA_523]WKC21890.1 NAD(P)H-quinone oxidoreductase [Rhizobium sp. SSA_523]
MNDMFAIEISEPGGPEVLKAVRRPVPAPGPGEIRIRVEAAGLNGADLAQRRGVYPPPEGASDLPGLEVAGIVDLCGDGVTDFQPGDRVCALLTGGGYAQYCCVPEGQVLPLPPEITMAQGAGLIEAIATVWTNVFETAALQRGETLLVHGGTSGIGTTAIQMAKLHHCKVIVTVGSEEKAKAALSLGADRAIIYRHEDFASVLKAEKTRIDVILDIVGGPYLDGNLKSLAYGGRLVVIAFSGGRMAQLDIARVMMNRLQITGSTLRSRPVAEKARIISEVRTKAWPWVQDGRFKPVIDSTFPFAEATAAHRRMEGSGHIGKIILEGFS